MGMWGGRKEGSSVPCRRAEGARRQERGGAGRSGGREGGGWKGPATEGGAGSVWGGAGARREGTRQWRGEAVRCGERDGEAGEEGGQGRKVRGRERGGGTGLRAPCRAAQSGRRRRRGGAAKRGGGRAENRDWRRDPVGDEGLRTVGAGEDPDPVPAEAAGRGWGAGWARGVSSHLSAALGSLAAGETGSEKSYRGRPASPASPPAPHTCPGRGRGAGARLSGEVPGEESEADCGSGLGLFLFFVGRQNLRQKCLQLRHGQILIGGA